LREEFTLFLFLFGRQWIDATVYGGGSVFLEFDGMIPWTSIREAFRGFFREDFAMTVIPFWN